MTKNKGGEKTKCLHCIGCPYLNEAAAALGSLGGKASKRTLSQSEAQRLQLKSAKKRAENSFSRRVQATIDMHNAVVKLKEDRGL